MSDLKEGSAIAVKELLERILQMPVDQRIDFLEMLVCAGIHFMRGGSGDEYVRGYLEHALSDLEKAPMFTLRDRSVN